MSHILKLNDFLKFTPFLIIYSIICIIKQQDAFIGDEGRYVMYADNLLNGFYASSSNEYSFLWNGPGYPLFLTLFRFIGIPLFVAKLCNGVFIYLGLVYIYKTLKQFSIQKVAFCSVIALGLYYPFLLDSIPYLLTESLCFFLLSIWCHHIYKYSNTSKSKHKWLAIVTLAFLALTKIVFGYVIIVLILIAVLLSVFIRTIPTKKYIPILAIAFSFTIPYLVYTYSLTDRILYYGNSGGMSLYWMSSPFEKEFGDWHWFDTLDEKPEIYNNHSKFLNTIDTLKPVEKNDALIKKAIHNISNNKAKYFKNWLSNIGRTFFDYPYSHCEKSNRLLITSFNSIVILLLIASLFFSYKHRSKINPVFFIIGLLLFIYLAGISLVSSYHRFLYIIYPVILVWISYIISTSISIKFKKY